MTTLLIVGITLLFLFIPLGKIFGFRPLPISFFMFIGMIVILYILTPEITKKMFYKRSEKVD